MSELKKIIKELVFPSKCKCCGQLADRNNLCENCAVKLAEERIPEGKRRLDKKFELVDKAYASYYYSGRAEDVVKYAKFRNPASFLNSFLEDISIDIDALLLENSIDKKRCSFDRISFVYNRLAIYLMCISLRIMRTNS